MSWTAQSYAKVLTHSTSKRERMFRVRPDNCSLKKLGIWLMDPSNRRRRNQNEPTVIQENLPKDPLLWWCGWVSLSCRKRPALFLRILYPMKVLSWMKGSATAWNEGPRTQEHLLPPHLPPYMPWSQSRIWGEADLLFSRGWKARPNPSLWASGLQHLAKEDYSQAFKLKEIYSACFQIC